MRIRHYGLLANRHRRPKLARCRELLGVATMAPSPEPIETRASDAGGDALDNSGPERALAPCPICGAPMRIVEILAPQPHDTS